MDFIMRKTLTVAAIVGLLAACGATSSEQSDAAMNDATTVLSAAQLQHHNWELVSVNGEAITVLEGFSVPNLEIGEKLTANGNAGCNNFFGQVELEGNSLRIAQMASTMKMCPEEVMSYEMAMSQGLSDWNDVKLTKQTLTLENGINTLEFTLKDWVH
ncbi:META domain-containing protein [Vibrio ulleungensis]|uniref:META domain-containing protein n=1 Tax=Vibrio ulleungensis TaxID=2807619 RepID=A0ABS2HED4_9VIBR|nr:META domain-containing protein [Vibrio ulleungensis]MBM7035945.1 META domain-containing protein [Vibrio ulleungensis]